MTHAVLAGTQKHRHKRHAHSAHMQCKEPTTAQPQRKHRAHTVLNVTIPLSLTSFLYRTHTSKTERVEKGPKRLSHAMPVRHTTDLHTRLSRALLAVEVGAERARAITRRRKNTAHAVQMRHMVLAGHTSQDGIPHLPPHGTRFAGHKYHKTDSHGIKDD